EQLLDDDMAPQAFPDDEAPGNSRHLIIHGPSGEPDSANGRYRLEPGGAVSLPDHRQAGSIITLGAPRTTTKLPPSGERKVRVVGPVFLPDPEGATGLRAPGPKNAR